MAEPTFDLDAIVEAAKVTSDGPKLKVFKSNGSVLALLNPQTKLASRANPYNRRIRWLSEYTIANFEGVANLPIEVKQYIGHTFFYRGDIQADDLIASGDNPGQQKNAHMNFLADKIVKECQLSGMQDIDMTPEQTRALAGALGKWNCRDNENYGVFSPSSSPHKRPLSREANTAEGASALRAGGMSGLEPSSKKKKN